MRRVRGTVACWRCRESRIPNAGTLTASGLCAPRSAAIPRTVALAGSATRTMIALFLLRPARDTGRAMSQENVEMVLAVLEAYRKPEVMALLASGDLDLGWLYPEIEWGAS